MGDSFDVIMAAYPSVETGGKFEPDRTVLPVPALHQHAELQAVGHRAAG